MTRTPHLAVLGTGRMGTAIATRLADHFPVVTWSRSGRAVAGLDATPSAEAAVKDADVVLLALFDAAACRTVLADVLDDLAADAVVVNTATVGPDEAEALADLVRRAGHRYLHAPVMGSLPAARAGELTILTGGAVDGQVREVLDRLGDLVDAADPGSAATAKLVAIGALGDSLLGVRQAVARGQTVGLDRAAVLSVLEHSPLGGLVRSKRSRLESDSSSADAEFTVGALAKDLALLASATGSTHRAAPLIATLTASGQLDESDDIAAVCTAATADERSTFTDARLDVAPDVDVPTELLEPLHAYALGHATGSAVHFRQAFRDTAHIEGIRDSSFVSWDLPAYCALFDGPSPDEVERRRTVESVQVTGTVATATMTLAHGNDRFTDLFLLLRDADGWRIANKVYHRS